MPKPEKIEQPDDLDMEKLPIEGEVGKKDRDLVLEFHRWINGGKELEAENFDLGKEENTKEKNIIETINFLNQNKYRIAFNNYPKSFDLIKDTINKTLDKIKENDNYFINAKLKQIEQKPLENNNWPIAKKRALLKREIGNIKYDNVIDESLIKKLENDSASDEEIDYIFNKYREFNPEYFYWLEDHDRRDDYHDQSLVNNYNIIPKLAEDNYDKLQITRDCCYSRMSDKYAAIYTPKGSVDSFFRIDEKLTLENEEAKKINGDISESNLEYFLNKFRKCAGSNNTEDMRYYLQIRKDLPNEIVNDIDAKLNLSLPEELDTEFGSKFKFDETISSFGSEAIENFKRMDKEKQEYLINNLESLLNKRKAEAGEKYFGFCSEDIEILDFYKSFMLHNPNDIKPYAHFSVCYYLYLRKDLPKNLVRDFEEKFSIEIPENLKSFENLDEYLDTPDTELLEPFRKPFSENMPDIQENMPDNLKELISFDFVKMQKYLYDKIDELDQKIKSTKIQPERLDINEVLENEGFKKENMSEKEYNKLVSIYEDLTELPMKEKIENEFGIELKDFNIREQVQFVNFLSSKSIKEVEQVKEFLNGAKDGEAKNNRIKAFLSLESGEEEMGGKILKIGGKLDSESADAVFAKYAEIIDIAEKIKTNLEGLFKTKKEISEEEIEKITQQLIKKAGCMLIDFSEKIEDGEINDEKKIIRLLENYITDLILTSSIYGTLKKGANKNDINIEDFKGVSFEKSSMGEITNDGELMKIVDDIYSKTKNKSVSESEIENYFQENKTSIDETEKESVKKIIRMIEIYQDNYEKTPKLQKILIETFKQKLREGGNNISMYLLIKNKRPYAFCRFGDMGNGKKHAASLNVDRIMQESAIGKTFFEECVKRENENFIINGECSFRKKIGSTYIDGLGFIATEVYDFEGEPSIKIEKNKNSSYHYKSYNQEDIIKEHNEKFLNNHYKNSDDHFVLKFKENNEECLSVAKRLLGSGYVMSRYFFYKSDVKNEFYCAFEKGGN